MPEILQAEAAFFGAVARTAEKLRGSGQPKWYLRARLDQMLDDHDITGADRDDAAARALLILDRFARMAPEKRPRPRPQGETA